MSNTPTAHIGARPEDIANVVLMPGDPKRSRFIAENFLEGARLVNDLRGVQGYTGSYRGRRVTVMASGMGMPSMGIYSYELFSFFGVEAIMRIGTVGGMSERVRVRDLILGMGASTDSAFATQYHLPGSFAPLCSYPLLSAATAIAEREGMRYHVGNLLSTDVFYWDDPTDNERWRHLGILGVEMEAAALYMNAARTGKQALAICTVSNHLVTGEETTAAERETTFTDMMTLALETALTVKEG